MAQIYHFYLYGRREDKYKFLLENDVYTVEWKEVSPQHPFYLFSPQNRALLPEYNEGWKITDIMLINSTGVKTHRDDFVFDFDISILRKRIEDFRNLNISDEQISKKYDIRDTCDWNLSSRRRSLALNNTWQEYFTQCLYRPFDLRAYYHHQDVVELPRQEVMRHILVGDNFGLICSRKQSQQGEWSLIGVTKGIIECCVISNNTKETNYIFPLYIYPDTENKQGNLLSDRTSNLSQKFLSAIRGKLNYIPTPKAIFYYAYAIFHSPTYRQRYAEFLKIDFPRLPLTTNNNLFQALSEKGEELVELHLMKSKKLNKIITKYPVSGDNAVTEVTYKQDEQRIYINKQQYFEGITPEVWMFKIGGYQVLDKWLKDRKKAKRSLSFDDVLHY